MPGFNPARKVEAGGLNNDCGLNCLTHVLASCRLDENSSANQSLLAAFKREHGAHYTWDEMLSELTTLTPRQRERKFSPVLREVYTEAYRTISARRSLPRFNGQPRNTLPPNTPVSDEELGLLGYYFHINVESYVGNCEIDQLAVCNNGLYHSSPAARLKLWMPTAQNTGHYSFQLPDNMDLNAYNNSCSNRPAPARNNPFEQKINTLFSSFESMFEKIFPNTSNADASNSWLGSIKSFFSFLAPVFKFFMGFATMFAGDENKTKTNEPVNGSVQANQAQQLAAAQAMAATQANGNQQQIQAQPAERVPPVQPQVSHAQQQQPQPDQQRSRRRANNNH